MLYLLTKRIPYELPTRRLKIDFRSFTSLVQERAEWLEKMLEPAVEDRFLSARDSLFALQSIEIEIGSQVTTPVAKAYNQEFDQAKLKPTSNTPLRSRQLIRVNPSLEKPCLSLSRTQTNRTCAKETELPSDAPHVFAINQPDPTRFVPQTITIQGKNYVLLMVTKSIEYEITGKVVDLVACHLKSHAISRLANPCCALFNGSDYYEFGHDYLSLEAQETLVEKINLFLDRFK